MLEAIERKSGHNVTVEYKGSNTEVCLAIADFINRFCNGGYGGSLQSFKQGDISKFDGANWYATCTRDSNCD